MITSVTFPAPIGLRIHYPPEQYYDATLGIASINALNTRFTDSES